MHRLFFVVSAGTNFLLGRAKSCQWQVFVRRRPPKQGELRTDVSKATMFQGDRKVTKFFCPTFCTLQKVGKSCCSDVQKVAGGKFLCVGAAFSGGHAAFLCCLRQPTAALRRLFHAFCKAQKTGQNHADGQNRTTTGKNVGLTSLWKKYIIIKE